ncbi:hypothetical protein [Emticicia fluvialis]|uniref:hypothetical protein n=1 Tax=Emticicia fluvialis TaxID=2974474 RepID=UPI00216686E6|nr:hypothetical protein [Emticicia fluvialis]
MRHLTIIFCCGILLSVGAKAQSIRLSENPQTFISEIKTVMGAEKNAIAIAMGDKFEVYWTTRFTDSQKTVLMNTTRRMGLKGHKMAQFYYLFLLIDKLITQENYNNTRLDNFLGVAQKTVEQYDLKTATRVFETFKDFLEKRRIYASGFNRLYVLGGTFDFTFSGKMPEAAKAAPPATTAAPAPEEESKLFDGWDVPVPVTPPLSAGNGLQELTKKPMPVLSGVAVEFSNADLVMATASDSVAISQTSGTIALKDGVFVGKAGTITWANLGLPQISATLADYTFEVRNPRFTAEDVTFTYPDRLTAPVKGVLEFKGEKRAKNVPASYPRFMSYQSDAFIKNIDKSIEYKGGFSIIGKRIFSSSASNSYAYITVKQDGKTVFKTSSTRFEINDAFINAQLASFVTYIGQDSIYHPAVKLNYIPADGLLKLNKIEAGSYRDALFIDSYHQLGIKCDAMRWNLAEGKMDFYIVSGKTQVPALFESLDFFDAQRLGRLSGGGSFNPLLVASNFVQKNNKSSFSVHEVGAFNNNRVSAQNLKSGFMLAEQQGFLYYNPITDLYSITRKGQHYLAANTGKKDFDDLLIPSIYGSSKDSTANASLNLTDKSLLIRGVKRFNLSDSLEAYVLPYDGIVKVGKNRTFAFNGQLKAKNFRFSGKELVLDYEKYSLSLPRIDSITFTPPDAYAKGATKEIGSKFKYDNAGVVYLNKPDNKSGRMHLPQYPILKIDKGVIVYFDDAYRGNRAFNREVRFEVPKIDFDSLNVKPLEFSGTFYSGNIFKPFKEKLKILTDTTIGFSHKVPGGKYPIYGSETSVKFASELVMDDKGLHTTGDINHLAATLTSDEIFFFTDSLTAKGKLGKVLETARPGGAYYPKVDVKDYTLKWVPKADSMLIASTEGFDFYLASSSLKGKILLRKTGLFGAGNLVRNDSETSSEQFKFNKEGFFADNSQFKIKASSPLTKAVLLAKNVDINFNITKSLVNIVGNEGNSFNDTTRQTSLEFPYAAYKTNIDKAEWNIKKKQISMKGDLASTLFASTNSAQEGLAFKGSSAVYDIEQLTLNIGGVPYIQSADARIMPNKGQVAIRKDAEMLPFKNARLTIDTLNGFHNLSNGNIQILSKSRFTGDASYQFVNARKDTFNIKMGDFELREVKLLAGPDGRKTKEKGYSTYAHATVRDRDSVYLSPKIIYQGEISMWAPVKTLAMDGFVLPVLKKYPKLGGYWIPYKGEKSEEVVITVDKNLKSDEEPLFAGLHFRTTTSTNGLYPTFLSAKETEEDQDVFVVNGVLRRDETNRLFSIKPDDPKATAVNKYELIEDKGIINLEGKYNLLGKELAQYMQTTGFATLRLDSSRHQFNTMMLVNFPVAQPILANMATKIVKTNLDLGVNEAAIELNSPELISKISYIVGEKDIEDYKLRSAKEYVPLFRFSPRFINTIVFSDLQLVWEPKQNAYRSVGKLGVSNIGETDINAKINGYVEIRKNPVTGDEVYVFLELSPESWYYMGYKENEMGIISSDDAFNALVTKGERRKDRGYQVIAVDHSEAILFRKMFLETYRGLKEPAKGTKADPKKLAEAPKEATQKKEEKKKKEEAEKEGF